MVLSPSDKLESSTGEEAQMDPRLDFTRISHPSLSFEYFPPKTEVGFDNLMKRLASMSDMNPEWIDVTFGAGGSTKDRTLEICEFAYQKRGLNVMMHLTCTNMNRSDIDYVLNRMKSIGLRNVLALRGDPPAGTYEWTQAKDGFSHAVDLVRYIRSTYGDYFCIGVAGYPEGHADCESFESDLAFLKAKVEAGADVIITQLFYDTSLFFKFVERLRAMGLTIPVIPGIMPIMSLASLKRMASMCRVRVPDHIIQDLESIQENDEAVKEYGVQLAVKMCHELIAEQVAGLHIYTMNNEEIVRKIVSHLAPILPGKHSEWLRS
jgi:methylenetetrahydrofolate reductase (NADPH)